MDLQKEVREALANNEWVLLNQYKEKYSMDWNKTIEECLDDEENYWEFRYNSKNEILMIRIITAYGDFGNEWNFYIVFIDAVDSLEKNRAVESLEGY